MDIFKNWGHLVVAIGFLGIMGCTPWGVKISNNQYGEWYDYESGYEMPEYPRIKPNKPTLQTYLDRYIDEQRRFLGFKISPSDEPSKFEKDLRDEPYIRKQLQSTALLSYLLYENGKIVVDELTPESRFGSQVKKDTPLPSRSIGKTLTSYMLGHAICAGYIESVESRMADWPVVEGTVYHNQKLIDLINMRAGDQKFAYTNQVFLPWQTNVRNRPCPNRRTPQRWGVYLC